MLNPKFWWALLVMTAVLILSGLACQQLARPASQPVAATAGGLNVTSTITPTATINPLIPPTRVPGSPYLTPTPDAPHPLPTPRTSSDDYTVQAGDSLAQIAARYGISYQMIVEANQISNPNLIDVGLQLIIPPPDPDQARPDFKIIPDSELVYGPFSAYFPVDEYVQTQGGYLSRYTEELEEGTTLSGAAIVQRVAQEYSVNPRLLLAVLEHASAWVTRVEPDEDTLNYPLGILDAGRQGLYLQLTFAANELNRGYYLWRVNGVATWVLADGAVLLPSPRVNAGTAGVQNFYSRLYGRADWETAIGPAGLFATYTRLFGYPFDYALEPLLPAALRQPALQLPFETGETWAFTGGPHGGWGSGSAWAALDFAPPGEMLGCVQSDAWVVAVAPGLVVRAENGAVVQDLDGDGLEQTGWSLLYMHIESRGRVKQGAYLQAGDRIGHASCEGGFSTGTHVHIARRYNGEWIPADGTQPFDLDGWVSTGAGREYDGYLIRNEQTIEAWNGRSEINQIQR
jgi:murein DD-endopeptidase MepM/ murein hydrolase activator NlpD